MSCGSELECQEEIDQLSMEDKLIWISPLICLAYSVPIDICAIFFYFNVASSFKLKSMAILFSFKVTIAGLFPCITVTWLGQVYR
jgi:hypothetical protein